MIDKKEYLLALKRTIFHKDTVSDITLVAEYLKERALDKFDKADSAEAMFHVQGYRRALSDLAIKMSLRPEQLDVEIKKAKQDDA